jgi:hypothetical protein
MGMAFSTPTRVLGVNFQPLRGAAFGSILMRDYYNRAFKDCNRKDRIFSTGFY